VCDKRKTRKAGSWNDYITGMFKTFSNLFRDKRFGQAQYIVRTGLFPKRVKVKNV